jgi:hypothetical protein
MLKVCISFDESKRPTEFQSTVDSGTSLVVLEREKK